MYIESKNWNWATRSISEIEGLKSHLPNLNRLAIQDKVTFVLNSKHTIPQYFKDWLNMKNIKFCEG